MLSRLNKFFIQYNFLMAFCAVAVTWYFAIIFNGSTEISYYCFNFFGTLATYNFLRHFSSYKQFFQDRRSLHFYTIVISMAICCISFFLLPFPARLYYLPLIILVELYCFPMFKNGTLRSVPFVKIFVIALVWVFSAAAVIFFANNTELVTPKKIAFIIAQLFFFIAITLPFDIKDVIYDRIKTIPNTIGIERSIVISKVCLLVYITLVLVFGTNPVFKLAHSAFAVLSLYVIHKQKVINSQKLYYYMDGLILAQTGFIFLFGHVVVR